MTNEEMNRLLATGVMGWTWEFLVSFGWAWVDEDGEVISRDDFPFSPTTDYNHLFMVMEKARGDGLLTAIEYGAAQDKVQIFDFHRLELIVDKSHEQEVIITACEAIIDAYRLEAQNEPTETN